MVKTITPFSTRAKEGATDSPLGDFVTVESNIQSTADVGFYDENGKLTGHKSSDREFSLYQLDSAIPNGQAIISPSEIISGQWPLDMTGFNDLQIAIKPSRGGNYAIEAIMGPDTLSYAGLTPINPASALRGNTSEYPVQMVTLLLDSADSLTADVWNIFMVKDTLRNQKLLQFKITNNAGGDSNIETNFMRLV
jgi:hypothetical protein